MSLSRRQALLALGGVAAAGGAGYVAVEGLGGDDVGVTVDTLDAQGSTAGQQRIPAPGQPMLVDLFATWCIPCEAQMRSLLEVYPDFRDDVAFVSVTNERVGNGLTLDDIRQWWADHDGRWTVGHDPESELMRALGAGGLPFLAVTDASGDVVWTHRGVAGPSTLREELEAVA